MLRWAILLAEGPLSLRGRLVGDGCASFDTTTLQVLALALEHVQRWRVFLWRLWQGRYVFLLCTMPPHFHTMEGYSQCGQANQHLARDAAKSVVERNKQGLLGRRCPLYLIQGKRYAEVKRQHACGRNHHLQAPGYGHVHDGGHQDPQREHPKRGGIGGQVGQER